jgi:hypothetical protein
VQPWWNGAVAEAVQNERQARRHWARTRTDQTWGEFQNASAAKQKAIAKAKQAHWRTGIHKAATSPEGIWKLAKWARTKSYLPREPAKMPNLQWNRVTATTASEKAAALRNRFFPIVEADLMDLTDPTDPTNHGFTGLTGPRSRRQSTERATHRPYSH